MAFCGIDVAKRVARGLDESNADAAEKLLECASTGNSAESNLFLMQVKLAEKPYVGTDLILHIDRNPSTTVRDFELSTTPSAGRP